jgi:hypothetical protein
MQTGTWSFFISLWIADPCHYFDFLFLMILLCGFLNIGTEAAPRKKGGAATA